MSEEVTCERTEGLLKMMKDSAGESDRGITLVIAAHIEVCLRRVLEAVLIDATAASGLFEGPYAPFGTLSGKTHAAFLMGLITRAERDQIDAIRGVRNVFAHETSASFDHPKIVQICSRPVVNGRRLTLRDEFLHMAMNAILPLLHRDLHIATWRRPELTQDLIDSWNYGAGVAQQRGDCA